MTTGNYLVELSELEYGTARNLFLMIKQHPTTITRVGGYKVVYTPENVVVVVENLTYKATVDTRGYKIVYTPNPTNLTREVENVTIKKGC